MTRVETPQSRCRAAFARGDITPPAGIYHRMWGAALHDRAAGVHRPLTATAMLLESEDGTGRLLVLGIDHCLLEGEEVAAIRDRVCRESGVKSEEVHISLSHTHGSAWLSRSRSHLPGGDLIGPYLDHVGEICAALARKALAALAPATIVYGTARCSLAAHRDFWDKSTRQYVCGFNPKGPADDTVMVAKVVADGGDRLGTIVNYACHPTTLAWQNTLVSPDYVGAMREVVEREYSAPCLFLQGASGDLGPREGYVGDTAVADRNGRQLGFAALSGLESLPPPGTRFNYAGAVVSGATLGTWEHRPIDPEVRARHAGFEGRRLTIPLPYRVDMPSPEETKAALARWEQEEAAARNSNDAARVRECRAQAERMTRQLARISTLPTGSMFPLPVGLWRLGDALWVFTSGELYQSFQTRLRSRFRRHAVVVATISDGWQPGYIPPGSTYGYGIYQETISPIGPGGLEILTTRVTRELRALVEEK